MRTALILLILTAPASADVFSLADGGRVVGELLNADQSPRSTYVIKASGGISVTLDRAQVANHEHTRPALEEYRAIRPTFPDTAEGQMKLADWCRDQGLLTERDDHLRRVIAIDPDHETARRALGYLQTEKGWMTRDELMTSRGYVKRGSRYWLPQELALADQRKKTERAEKEWYQKIRMWRGWLEKPARAVEAQQQLAEIDDPLALAAIRQNLDEEPHPAVRKMYLEALSRFDLIEANELIVQVSLSDPDMDVRLTAMEHLAKGETPPEATMAYIKALRSKDNEVLNRAANALAVIGDPAAIGPLIDALVTEHKFKVTQGSPGGLSMTFGGSSGGVGGGNSLSGMSAGSSTKQYTQHIPNHDVLGALNALTGQNYNFNVAAWKQWWAYQKTPESLNARRD